MGRLAAPALSEFVSELHRGGANRLDAISGIEAIGLADQDAVLTLCATLRDKDADLRAAAARCLGRLGPAARQIVVGDGEVEVAVAVPALLRALGDRDGDVRVQAALALWKVGHRTEALLTLLVRALSVPGDEVPERGGAAEALGEIGAEGRAAVPSLIRALRSPDEKVRFLAARVLGAMGPAAASAAPELAVLLEGTAEGLAEQAAQALTKLGPQGLEVLNKALTGNLADVRLLVCVALGDAAPPTDDASARTRHQLLPALATAARDPDPRLRRAAVAAVGRLKPRREGIQVLAAAIFDDDAEVRKNAREALTGSGPAIRFAIPTLLLALRDRDDQVRQWAASLLRQARPDAACVPALIEALVDREADIRLEIVAALGAVGRPARPALPALRDALRDPDGRVRARAALACWNLGGPDNRVVAVLAELLWSGKGETRVEAALALCRIARTPESGRVLTALLRDEDAAIRAKASEAVRSLGPDAKRFVPLLRPLLEDERRAVQSEVRDLLQQIAPPAARTELADRR